MADPSGTTAYGYDALGRLTNKVVSWTNGPVRALNYGYSTNGSLTNLWSSTSGGVTNNYQYDLLGRLTNVLANGGAAAGYGYDGLGNLQVVHLGNGLTNLYQYDARNRLTNLVWRLNATALGSFAYQLGPTGNRTNLGETVNGTARNYGWAYDYLYRLTGETISGMGGVSYAYDAVGNRTNRTSAISQLATGSSSYNANDLLTSDGYDPNGNTTNSTGNAYQYDVLNHLTNVNSGSIVISYDGDGNRMSKKVGTTTAYYLVDDRNPSGYAQVVEEWTASSGTTNLARVYNYGMALISQRAPGVSTNYFVGDGHGSTRLLVDIGGNIVNTFTYDAYGTLIASNSSPQTAYLYCGEQFDADLGFYYLRARYMNPGSGRFWTMDSYGGDTQDPISLHKYLYCPVNTVNGYDPSGHAEDSISLGTVMTCGAIIGATSAYYANIAQGRAQTALSIIQGAAYGALLAPLAVASTPIAVGLGLYGGYETSRTFTPILLDPNATTQQKIAAGGLILSAFYGTATAFKYANTANCIASSGFVAGTSVETDNGDKAIEDICVGDRVLAYDFATGEEKYEEVKSCFVRSVNRLVKIETSGVDIVSTPEHPYFVWNKGWLAASELRPGFQLFDDSKRPLTVIGVEPEYQLANVYNFEVNDLHNYFVSQHHVLVHNACTPPAAKSPPPTPSALISMDDAINMATLWLDGQGSVGVSGSKNIQFIRTFTDASGNTVRQIARFDVSPSGHIIENGVYRPHLNLETRIVGPNGQSVSPPFNPNAHIYIDPNTVIRGDYP